MENNTAVISTATNKNILLQIVENKTTKNAVACQAGIPATTFNRKVDGKADWTIKELGDVAKVFGLTFWDLLPANPLPVRKAA